MTRFFDFLCRFRADRSDNVLTAHINDRVHIRCPRCDMQEATIIYRVRIQRHAQYTHCTLVVPVQVSAHGYSQCTVADVDARPIGECSCPANDRTAATLTMVFRAFSPYGLEYAAGQSYYFISACTTVTFYRTAYATLVKCPCSNVDRSAVGLGAKVGRPMRQRQHAFARRHARCEPRIRAKHRLAAVA